MHLIRRSTLRAASSAAASSPFVLGTKAQSALSSTVLRRFIGDDSYGRGGGGYNNSRRDLVGRSIFPDRRRATSYGERRAPRPNANLTPSNTIYVGNLLFDIRAEELEKEFAEFGPIKSSRIATDMRGLSKGFGYVEFETEEQAANAIRAKHQSEYEGRNIVVSYQITTPRSQTENPPSKTLYIGNLPYEMSDSDLNSLFRDLNNVIDVRVAIDRRTGQPRGFAHADFVDVDSAVRAYEELNGKDVYGRNLRCDYSAGARERRGDGSGNPRQAREEPSEPSNSESSEPSEPSGTSSF